jgi:hypothetical protein
MKAETAHHSIQIGYGVHPVSYQLGATCSVLSNKAAPSAILQNVWNYTSIPNIYMV